MRMKDDKFDHAVNNFTMEFAIAKMSDIKESCLSMDEAKVSAESSPHMFRKLTLLAALLSASHASSPTTRLSLPGRSQRYNPTRAALALWSGVRGRVEGELLGRMVREGIDGAAAERVGNICIPDCSFLVD